MSDLIDRQAAIDALCNDYCGGHQDCKYYPNCENLRSVQKLPSAEPERKTGHWLKISPAGIYECSECGKNVMTADIDAYEFCHGCGCRMMEVEHETD